MNRKKILFWIIALLITLSSAIYQRLTGPTHPKSFKFSLDNQEYKYSLPRSQNGYVDAIISLEIDNPDIAGYIIYKRFNVSEPFDTIMLKRENDKLIAWLPKQPAAGKLEYGVRLFTKQGMIDIPENENVVIRFKDEVPAYVLIPHVILIFIAMLLSNLTGIYAIVGVKKYRFYTIITLIFFLLGGMIMGPIVQKFAFGEFWTGFPFGKDLTDNKALIAFIMWIIAWVGNRKEERRYLVIIASIVTLAIFLIPHSLMGSELDYSSGEIKTGMIRFNSLIG